MESLEWTYVDRTGWPSGEWDGEPDQVQWQDEATGLPCLAKRNHRSGNWCGYVGVSEGHRYFEAKYDEPTVDVHGGLTYADFCEGEPGKNICHLPVPGETDRVWWLGFDCAHSGDYSPRDKADERDRGGCFALIDGYEQYRTLAYVKNQCHGLAAQLAT